MRHRATTFLASILVLALAPALVHAAPTRPLDFGARLGGGITVPPEWAGVWMTTDSIYSCAGVLQSTSTDLDTLCAGQTYQEDPTFECTGSATATSYQMSCTGREELFPGCDQVFAVEAHGTRTGDSFFSVSTVTISTSGTAEGCDLFPGSCTQVNTHGTRIGPPPEPHCSTPARSATWGEVKALYR